MRRLCLRAGNRGEEKVVMKNKLFASVPNILFGAMITIAPQTFAHACTGHDMPGAATTRSRRPPASASSSSCSASWLCSSPRRFASASISPPQPTPATTRRTHLSDRHLQGRDDALSHGYAAHAHRARRAHHRVRGHRHLARLSRRQAQLIEQTAGAQPFRTLDSGLAYCNRTISNIRIHRAIPYRIARPSD